MIAKRKVAVLISGRGSNLQALLDAAKAPDYPAEFALVISNRPGAQGLERAAKAGVATQLIDHKDFESREEFDDAVDAALAAAGVDLVCLAGFMRLLSDGFVNKWRDRILNVHPSLLPSFKGLHVHERVLDAGVRITGCSVHIIRSEMDSGPIIAQAAVPVVPDDTPESLATRVLAAEHRLYPLALALFASRRARVQGERVVLDGPALASGALFSPGED